MTAPRETTIEDQPERCRAVLKAIWRWRCHRRGFGPYQLCDQHQRFGCKVPAYWDHQVNSYGVDHPEPEGRWTTIPPARLLTRKEK